MLDFRGRQVKINLENINYYFLTCNNPTRKEHILKEFKNYKLTEVNPIMNIGKYKSTTTGFSRILDLVCQNQDKNKPFNPFVIFEDDVKKYREFPSEIEIPNDTDILYIGLSTWGMTNTQIGVNNAVRFKNIDKDIIKVYNMLAFHGIIICSMRGLLAIQKCMLESYFKSVVYDIFTSQIQPYINAYALKIPLVYQNHCVGGRESATKINYDNIKEKELPNEWKNTTNISIITNFNS